MKTVEQYLEMPYHVSVTRGGGPNGSARWAATVEELPDCTATGPTPEEAVKRLRRAMSRWIADALRNDREVPEPRRESTASGRLLVRMPRTLHAELAGAAEREGVSLNQFITGALAATVRWRGAGAEPAMEEPAEEPPRRRARMLTIALVSNYVFIVAACALAVAALVAAWR
ncbi:MAG: type II toxin-antitoxin system HicB family antitoxin [Thermoleophilia bacterium]|nr:type II toxin-antitoxin system HicB family antitoxin [Thermoleophilia bacterium]